MLKKILFLLGAVLFVAACSNPSEPVITVDTEAPVIGAFTVPATTESASVIITLEAQDNTAVTAYALAVADRSASAPDAPPADSDLWQDEAPGSVSLPQGEFGAYSIYAWARDAAGNVSESAVKDIDYRTPVVPDTEAPVINSFTAPASIIGLSIALTIDASDNVDVTAYYITHTAQGAAAPATPAADSLDWETVKPSTYTVPALGDYSIYLWAIDAAGNISTVKSVAASFLADTEAPVVNSFTAPASIIGLSVALTIDASDNVAVTAYYVTHTAQGAAVPATPAADSLDWETTEPSTYTVPALGDYSIYLWTMDAAGNISTAESVNTSFLADTEAPVVSNFTVPATSNSLSISVSVTATDNVAVSAYYITHEAQGNPAPADPAADHASWVSTSPTNYTLPADGDYTLYLWTKDSSDNISTRSQANISADSSAPSISTFSLALAASGNGDIDLTISASDASAISGYYVGNSSQTPSLSDPGWQASAPTTFSNTDFGNLTLYLWVKDSFDNLASDSATVVRNFNSIILYYGAADNDLEIYLYADMNEMEMVDTSAEGIKTIALFDRGTTPDGSGNDFIGDGNWTSTRAYEIGYDAGGFDFTLDPSTQRIAIPSLGITETNNIELSMDSPNTLAAFVEFGMNSYPSDNYVLIMSNHGGGWRDDEDRAEERMNAMAVDKAICWDDTSGANESLYMNEVRTAINTNKLDLIAFDACLMGMAEVIYELKDSADYIVASEEVIPGFGYPYNQIMTAYKANPQATMVEVGTFLVDSYIDAYTNGTNIESPGTTADDITLTLYDTAYANSLATALNSLGNELLSTYLDADSRFLTLSMAEADFADLGDFLVNETANLNQASSSSSAVSTALSNLVVHHGAPATGPYSESTGMAVFFPAIAEDLANSDYTSANIQLATAAPRWIDFIHGMSPVSSSIDQLELETFTAVGGSSYPATVTGANWNINDVDQYLVLATTTTADICTIDVAAGKDYALRVIPLDSSGAFLTDYIYDVDAGGNGVDESFTIMAAPNSVASLVLVVQNPNTYSFGNTYTVSVTTP